MSERQTSARKSLGLEMWSKAKLLAKAEDEARSEGEARLLTQHVRYPWKLRRLVPRMPLSKLQG